MLHYCTEFRAERNYVLFQRMWEKLVRIY
jgi:hypothetical protein